MFSKVKKKSITLLCTVINHLEIMDKIRSRKIHETIRKINIRQYTEKRNLVEHTSKVKKLIKLNQRLFASTSEDNIIKVWDYIKGVCVNNLNIHQTKVMYILKLNENQIASSAKDCVIKISEFYNKKSNNNYNSSSCNRNGNTNKGPNKTNNSDICLYGHSNFVNSIIKINKKQIASGSCDFKVKLWDFTKGTCLKTITNTGPVYLIIKLNFKNRIISWCGDHKIIVWYYLNFKSKSESFFSKDKEIWSPNSMTQIDKSLVAYFNVGNNGMIVVHDFDKGIKYKKLEHKNNVICVVKLDQNLIASGNDFASIKIWDYKKGRCIQTLVVPLGPVNCLLRLNKYQIASGWVDNSIHIWDLF